MGTVSSPLVPVNQVSHIIEFIMANFTFIELHILIITFGIEKVHHKVCHFNPMSANILQNFRIATKTVVVVDDHGGSGVEQSNHTTASQICPNMGRCCSWHTSGGVVLHPHQLAGGDVRGTNQSHGVLPW
jgi:hypothetical protein